MILRDVADSESLEVAPACLLGARDKGVDDRGVLQPNAWHHSHEHLQVVQAQGT
jgi:hypothetical protein